jgi:hypothetical protein
MKGRSTRLLLLAIIILGLFIWGQETWRARIPSKEYRRVKLFDLDAATLVSIQFKYTNTTVDCVKENGVWMTGGTGRGMGRADIAMVFRLVAGLNSMGKGTVITSKHMEMRGFDAGEYGFDQPSLKISAVDNQGRHGWEIGRKAPLGNMVYVREIGTSDIYTVPDKILEIAPVKSEQLRDRTLFDGDAPGVRRIEIRGSGGFVQILKDNQTGWHIQQPESAPADEQVVESYIEQLYRLRAEDFVAENISDFSVYGLQSDARQISLGGAGETSRMVVLGDEIPDRPGFLYARRADDMSVFTLKDNVLDLLNVTPDRFRDASLLSLAPEKISHISVTYNGEKLAFSADESRAWTISSPMAWPASKAAVDDFLKTWSDAVITEFNVQAEAVDAAWSFEFASDELGVTNRIDVLPVNGRKDGLLVRRDKSRTLFQINLASVPDSMGNPLHFKSRDIWRLDLGDIRKVSISGQDRTQQQVERQEDGSFVVVGTNGNAQINLDAWGDFSQRLLLMTTSQYVTYNPRELDIYGLADPLLELHVGLKGTNELGRVLLIGHETAQGYYSMVKGRDVVFLLNKRLVQSLMVDLYAESEAVVLGVE